jgi:hypothetical protein
MRDKEEGRKRLRKPVRDEEGTEGHKEVKNKKQNKNVKP